MSAKIGHFQNPSPAYPVMSIQNVKTVITKSMYSKNGNIEKKLC